MAAPLIDGFPQFFDDSGNPLSGGKLYTYNAGTTTPLASYTNRSGAVPNANPVILDAAGRASVWLDEELSYRLLLKTADEVTVKDVDNVQLSNGAGSIGGSVSYSEETQTAAAAQVTFDLVAGSYTPGANSLAVYVDGVHLPLTDYTEVSNTRVTFDSPFLGSEQVTFRCGRTINAGAGAESISFLQGGTGAVARPASEVLQETVSVTDYEADPTGVDDSAAAIQAAIDAVYARGGGEVWLPEGQYKLTTTLNMKRGVTLAGPFTYLSIGQVYDGTAPEAVITGVAVLRPTSAVTTQAVTYNFQAADRTEHPYGACLLNICIDSRDQASGDCVYVNPPAASQGPFNSGFGNDSLEFHNCVFRGAPRYGFRLESTATETTNAYFYNCRFGLNGSHGLYALRCFDIKLFWCYSFENGGDGAYLDGCATERVIGSDFFNNDGDGITLDGFDGRYLGCAFENNGLHGVRVICSTSGQTQKRYRFTDSRFGTNSFAADNTYDNFHISDLAGAGISGITWVNCSWGLQPHTGTANRVRAEVYATQLPTQAGNSMVACHVAQNDLKTGNDYFNENFWQATQFAGSFSPDGNELAPHYRAFGAWTGGAAPNTIRGVTHYKTANVAGATITGLTNGGTASTQGREVWVLIDDANTGVDFSGSTLKGNGGVDLAAPATGKLIHFKNYDGTNWAATIYG